MIMKTRRNCVRLKSSVVAIPQNPDEVVLRQGIWNSAYLTLRDECRQKKLSSIICAFDGKQTNEQIAKSHKISISELEDIICRLDQAGVIAYGPINLIEQYVETSYLSLDSKETKILPVCLVGEKAICNKLETLLYQSFGDMIEVKNESNLINQLVSEKNVESELDYQKQQEQFLCFKNHFFVFAYQQVNPAVLTRFNRIAIDLHLTWLHAVIDGPYLFVGPTFEPGKACYDCLEARVSMNLRNSDQYHKYKKAICLSQNLDKSYINISTPITDLFVSHIAMETLSYVVSKKNMTTERMLSIYLPSLEMRFNQLIPLESCSGCGGGKQRTIQQLFFDIEEAIGNQNEHKIH